MNAARAGDAEKSECRGKQNRAKCDTAEPASILRATCLRRGWRGSYRLPKMGKQHALRTIIDAALPIKMDRGP